MSTASFAFLTFCTIAAVISNVRGTATWRQAILLISSIAFLAFFSQGALYWIPFATFLGFGYVSVSLIQSGWRRTGLMPIVAAVIALFVWIKKYSFIPQPLFIHFPYTTLGLSYIFFRVLHLIIDSFHGQINGNVTLARYLTYLLNFTTFLSGPIQRYEDFSSSLQNGRPLTAGDVGNALQRIVVGFFKVNVLSLSLSAIQTGALNDLHSAATFQQLVLQCALIVGAYPLYLYCNFSGYIDMVIGVARFLRLDLPENFNRPFSSGNFMTFWSRWHITLSEWLKTYVYSPLLITSMRRYPSRQLEPFLGAFAIFVTFFLVGLWHGQTSEFLFFGLLQGGGVAAVKLYQVMMAQRLGKKRYRALAANTLYVDISRGLTFTWFAFTLLWFWSNWFQIGVLAGGANRVAFPVAMLALWVVATALLAVWERLRNALMNLQSGEQAWLFSRYTRTVYNTALAVVAIAVVSLLNAPAPDLVYKAF